MVFFITNFHEGRHGKLTENNYTKEYYGRQSFGIWLFDHHLKKMAEEIYNFILESNPPLPPSSLRNNIHQDRNDKAPAA